MSTVNPAVTRFRHPALVLSLMCLLSTNAFALLPMPTRPTTFPLQRPSLVGDLDVSGVYIPPPYLPGGQIDSKTEVPPGLTGIVQVATGGTGQASIQSAALKSDGTVAVWGKYVKGGTIFGNFIPPIVVDVKSLVPPGLNRVVQVAVGNTMMAAVKDDGTVVAWGGYYKINPANNSTQATSTVEWVDASTDVPAGLTGVVQVAVGDSFIVALKSDGTVVAWGGYLSFSIDPFLGGQFQWINAASDVPSGLTGVVQVACKFGRAIALKSDGTAVLWGVASNSKIATGATAGWTNLVQVSLGNETVIGLKNDGTLVAKKFNYNYSTFPFIDLPTSVALTNLAKLATNFESFPVAIKSDGSAVSWSYDYSTNIPTTFTPSASLMFGKTIQLEQSLMGYVALGLTAPKISTFTSNGTTFPIYGQYTTMGSFVNESFTAQLNGTSGKAPYTFQFVSGSGSALPAGVSLSSNGTITGTPTVPGGTTFQVRITDANNMSSVIWIDFRVPSVSSAGGGFTFTNFVGNPAGFSGSADGTGRGATFQEPTGAAFGMDGSLFVTERYNDSLRKVSSAGVVTKIATNLTGSADATGGVAVDGAGNIYVAGLNAIRKFTSGGAPAGFFGSVGLSGSADGTSTTARFNQTSDVAVDAAGNIYVADAGNHAIRKISVGGNVTTLAGLMGSKGTANGTGSAARFNTPNGVAVDPSGNVYVADTGNCLIRKITPGGTVSTVAGAAFTGSADLPREWGGVRSGFIGSGDYTAVQSTDGTGTAATFGLPVGIEVDRDGNLLVGDVNSGKVRKVTPAGVVTTIGDDPNAFFIDFPAGIASDSSGSVFVADTFNGRVAKGIPDAVPPQKPSVANLFEVADTQLPNLGWSLDTLAATRVYFATSTSPSSTFGGSSVVVGSGIFAPSSGELNAMGDALGDSPTYYWTVGSAHDGGKTLFAPWQALPNGKARLTSPTSGSTLVSGPTTFSWSAGGPPTNGYALWIGSEPGSYDLYAGNEGSNTSKTVTTLPTDGRPIYVRLWTQQYDVWQLYTNYFFITQRASGSRVKAQMITPANGSSLVSTSTTLTWDAGTGAQQYALWVGSTPGGTDLYAAGEALRTSKTLTLPADGRQIYVRLWTSFDGSWKEYNAYTFKAPQLPTAAAEVTSPVEGATLSAGPTTFTWSAGQRGEEYALWIGSSPGAFDLYAGGEGKNLSKTLSNLPQDGRPIYLRLWTKIDGKWERYNGYTFTTARTAGSNVKAQMLTPSNVSTLTGADATFTWDAGTGAQKYALWVGSKPDTSDLYAADEGKNLSKTLSLPADGRQVYVRLWTMFNGAWQQFNNYVYTTPFVQAAEAEIQTPVDGSTLASGSTTFTWTAGARADQYALWIGSTPGGFDLYSGGEAKNLSKTLLNLPQDGRPVYVRLWTMIDGKWERFKSYTFTTPVAPGPVKAQLTSPTNNSTLAAGTLALTWNTGNRAENYALWIGSTPGGTDIYAGAEGANTSKSLTVPSDGRQIYVRLWTMFGGRWEKFNDYTFTTAIATGPLATITSPSNGSKLATTSTSFTWSTGTGAQQYALWIGSSPGGYDLYAGAEGKNVSKTVATLPQDGRPLFVRLWTNLNGTWSQYNNYTFTAYSAPSQVKAQLTSPTNGSTLSNGTTTLTWDTGSGAQQYALWVGSTLGGTDLYAGGEALRTSKDLTLPADGRPVYVRLWTMFNGAWQQFSEYTFTTAIAPGPAKAQMTSPTNGSTFSSTSVTFTWNAGSQAQQYALWVGSAPGASDIYAGGEALRTSKALTIPATGKPVYVRLWTMLNGAWTDYNTYVYTAKGP